MPDESPPSRLSQALAGLPQGPAESCGDFGLSIARDGTWFHRGTPIGRMGLVKLFARVLRRESDGRFWLVTPYERGTIEVADSPFVGVDVDFAGEGEGQTVTVRTNLDETATLGLAHPMRVAIGPEGERVPYIAVRDGLEARLARAPFYRLVERAVPGADGALGVWSEGTFHELGPAA
jgi:uncharacterized protein